MSTGKNGLADTVEKSNREADGSGNDGCLRHGEGYEMGCEYCEYRVKRGYRKVWTDELKQRRPVG